MDPADFQSLDEKLKAIKVFDFRMSCRDDREDLRRWGERIEEKGMGRLGGIAGDLGIRRREEAFHEVAEGGISKAPSFFHFRSIKSFVVLLYGEAEQRMLGEKRL